MRKIESKHFEVKRTVEGTNTSVDFVAKVKTVVAPEIMESYIDDAGDMQHILKNGNVLSENNYILHWGQRKSAVQWNAKTEKVNPNPFTLK